MKGFKGRPLLSKSAALHGLAHIEILESNTNL